MQKSGNFPIVAAVALFVFLYLFLSMGSNNENFSTSGLAVSDKYCTQLADVYYQPRISDIDMRNDFRKRICGKVRRETVDFPVGNYYTRNGMLL